MRFQSYSDVNTIVSRAAPSPKSADARGAGLWSLSFRPDRDTTGLFPYINAAMDDALYYEQPEHVTFLLDGFRCFLYPGMASAHLFESRDKAEGFIPQFMALLNGIDRQKAHIRPNFDRIRQIPVVDILRFLPGTNCRECGFATCMAFAAAVAKGRAPANICPGLAEPMKEEAIYPVLDAQGNLSHSVSLKIDTAGLKQHIRLQEDHIRKLEAQLKTTVHGDAPDIPIRPGKDFGLTPREIEVLEQISRGYTNNEIGSRLFISPHTVKSHMINIFNKMGVCDRTQAAVLACRNNLI